MSTPACIRVTLNSPRDASYDVLVGAGLLDRAGAICRDHGLRGRAFIITHPRIERLYGARLAAGFRGAGISCVVHTFPEGEEHKSWNTLSDVLQRLVHEGVSLREDAFVVGLGGGVVTDLAGFAAACYRRGVPFVSVPTTMLGFADCGIGGKTGVNLGGVKNIAGAFHQPVVVVSDTDCLATLPARQLRSGLAEVLKHGMIADARLFGLLETQYTAVLALEPEVIREIVVRSYEIKARVVERDERDTAGPRALLNFGHTLGHALESATGYAKFTHGEAVAVGMVCAADLSLRMGMCPPEVPARLQEALRAYGLPRSAPGVEFGVVWDALSRDKKFRGGLARVVLPNAVGSASLVNLPDTDLLRRCVVDRLAPMPGG